VPTRIHVTTESLQLSAATWDAASTIVQQGSSNWNQAYNTSTVYQETSGQFALSSDPRFINARTPTVHASSHYVGGSDPIDAIQLLNATSLVLDTINGDPDLIVPRTAQLMDTANLVPVLSYPDTTPGWVIEDTTTFRSALGLNTAAQMPSGHFVSTTEYQNTSGNWQSTYATVCSLSSQWSPQSLSFNEGLQQLSISNGNNVSLSSLAISSVNIPTIVAYLSSNNISLSGVTLSPITTLSGTNIARSLQDKLSEVISVRDFGAKGDGVTNDTAALQLAFNVAASSAKVYIPRGTYMIRQELKIPSNSYIYGAGIGTSVIKLSAGVSANQCVMTNSQNTRNINTNQGNVNIIIKDLELDGNVQRFPGSYSVNEPTDGTGLCFAFVQDALVESVSVHDCCNHCFDISAPTTTLNSNPLEYTPNPSSNIHLKDIIAYGAGDDNITTHFSRNIIIENAYVPYTGGTLVGTNSNGIEIDDGSYDVTIIGGYIKNCRRGLEIKGHSYAPAAKRIRVYGLTVEGCVRNFGIRHLGFDFTDSQTAYDIALYECTSIAPLSSVFTTDGPRSLQISNYDGVYVKDFKVVGEHNTSRAVTIQERARNVRIDGMTFTDISGSNTGVTDGLLYIDSTTRRNVTLQNITFRNCIGQPIYVAGSVPGITIDSVDAYTTVSPKVSAVIDFTWSPTTVPYTIRNVSLSGYDYAYELGSSHDFDYTLASNVGIIENVVPLSPATANSQYTAARLGWREGTGQSLNAGVGVRMDFTSNIVTGISAGLNVPVAYIGTRKVNGTDSDVTSNLTLGTLSANNSTLVDRMNITPTGNIGINTATPNERLTVVGNISATGVVYSNTPVFGGYGSVAVFFPTSVWTKVVIDTKEIDTNNNFNTTLATGFSGRFTPTVPGYYQLNGSIQLTVGSPATESAIFALYKNGSEFRRGSRVPLNTVGVGLTISQVVSANGSTDYFELYLIHGSSGTVVNETGAANVGPQFNGAFIRNL
jgi:hypothetical protein